MSLDQMRNTFFPPLFPYFCTSQFCRAFFLFSVYYHSWIDAYCMHTIFSTNYYYVKIVITMLNIARVFAEGLKIKCCLMMLSVSSSFIPVVLKLILAESMLLKCPNNMLVSWWCRNCCWFMGGKLIFVKLWSTIFGVFEWCAEKLFCESWWRYTPWKVNCQNHRLWTHTLKINWRHSIILLWLIWPIDPN